MNAIRLKTTTTHGNEDFRAYLEKSLRDPFTINLDGLSLMEVIAACKKAKSRGFEVDEMDFPFLNSQECGYGDKVRVIVLPKED